MKYKNLSIVMCIYAFLSFESCANHNKQENRVGEYDDTILVEKNNFEVDEEYVKYLIKEDQKKRNIMSWIDTTSSPWFYETINDDCLLLYRVINHDHKICVIMLDDQNIATGGDDICYKDDTTAVVYEHKGYYKIVDDSIVNVIFDEWYTNRCYTRDSTIIEPIYHIRCVHSYKLSGLVWSRLKADTAIVIDKRSKAFCEDIWEYTN